MTLLHLVARDDGDAPDATTPACTVISTAYVLSGTSSAPASGWTLAPTKAPEPAPAHGQHHAPATTPSTAPGTPVVARPQRAATERNALLGLVLALCATILLLAGGVGMTMKESAGAAAAASSTTPATARNEG